MTATNESSNWSAFLSGLFIGAGIAMLMTPQSGSEFRSTLRNYASKAKDQLDDVAEQGRATWDTAVQRGQEYVEEGRQALRNAGRTAREFADDTTQKAEQTANEALSRRG